MDDAEFLAERFEGHRAHLRAVAYRILGSASEADDAVQEAWLRLHRADAGGVENLGGWLTTVVGRICLDMLRSRAARREDPPTDRDPLVGGADPEQAAELADSIGLALLLVLDTLSPAERLAFVLHDVFAVPFDEIATVLDRSPAAVRQLASRARRRVQSTPQQHATAVTDNARRRLVIDAFLAAARGGDFDGLLAVLDPDVVMRADRALPWLGGSAELRGREAVHATFLGRAHGSHTALINGVAGSVWTPAGVLQGALRFAVADGTIRAIEVVSDPDELARLEITLLDAGASS